MAGGFYLSDYFSSVNKPPVFKDFPPFYNNEVMFVNNKPFPSILAVEGLGSTGKTTIVNHVEMKLKKEGINCWISHSPNFNLSRGEELRNILKTGSRIGKPSTISLFMENQMAIEKDFRKSSAQKFIEDPDTPQIAIFDRSSICGLAYSLMQSPENSSYIMSYYNFLPKPEFLILCETSEEIRQQRYANSEKKKGIGYKSTL